MMNLKAAMRKATGLTRSYNLLSATRVIQEALRGPTGTLPSMSPLPPRPTTDAIPALTAPSAPETRISKPAVGKTKPPKRSRRPLGEVVRVLREFRPLASRQARTNHPQIQIPAGAQYFARSFTCFAGSRDYKLYIPSSVGARPRGLLVMLHGCTQNPDDFAAGTAMNDIAEKNGLLVAYPHQSGVSNPASCWNWFNPADQMRDQGEPAILAGMTRAIATEFNIERRDVFVAGLSAGGAMAAVLAETYPDLYAGVGIHSGLAYRSAHDVITAFAAMRGQVSARQHGELDYSDKRERVRTIVFHGTADKTVHPANAEYIAAAAGENGTSKIQRCHAKGRNGRSYTRIVAGLDEAPILERWTVDGLGHAWSGGKSAGSYTDQLGPDASAEMVRFFLQ